MASEARASQSIPPLIISEHHTRRETLKQITRIVLLRLLKMALTLLVIIFLTRFLLIMAARGRQGLPAAPETAMVEGAGQTFNYLFNHPITYYLHKQNILTTQVVWEALLNSTGLLLFSLGLATLCGVPLGITMALSKRGGGRVWMLLTSVLLTSIPSFLLAMLLWIVSLEAHQHLATPQLPVTGFGWDAHILLPALVLMARPLAQIAQVTYVTMQYVMQQDFIRVAYAKGFSRFAVIDRHALKNTAIPIMTTMGASLRFSLASLPVVETFFLWPGVGVLLLNSIQLGYDALTTDLIAALGFLFLVLNFILDFAYPLIDARLRQQADHTEVEERNNRRHRLQDWGRDVREWQRGLRDRLVHLFRKRSALPALPVRPGALSEASAGKPVISHSRGWLLSLIIHNGPLLIGLVLFGVMLMLVLAGDRLTDKNPYQTHGVLMLDNTIAAPPFKPTATFPWGSDAVGRDIQALILWGARQTLSLALLAMVARVLLGTLLGAIAGWTQGSKFDRLVTGGIDVWAAFPVTIFAMLLIQAIGIQQGTWVFIVALALVGWGEVAQFVRSNVIAIKPQPFVEAARAIGVQPGRMLSRHVFPNLLPALVVLGALEMGAVLMLLAELGYLNIFLGGGFRAEIGESGRAQAVIYYFSDIPEWGALLANVRNWWRSYPWMVWYAGLAFFMAIMTFNLLAEGLRRFLDESRVNVGRVFNRYTALAAAAGGLIWILWSTAPVGQYGDEALKFESPRALKDIVELSSGEMAGRETGMPGAKAAAGYIEQRMKEIGLQPAGDDPGYIQEFPCPRSHLAEVPVLEVFDPQTGLTQTLQYRQDFAEYVNMPLQISGERNAPLVGLALGPEPDQPGGDSYQLNNLEVRDKIVVIDESQLDRLKPPRVGGLLIITEDPAALQRKYLFQDDSLRPTGPPALLITPQLADKLLAPLGSSTAALKNAGERLPVATAQATPPGPRAHLKIAPQSGDNDLCYNVTGFIPGTAARTTAGVTEALDSQVILISAYYDGLGQGPDGLVYRGANDNASGVAALLEMARVLKYSPYAPKKTIVFSAWSGGERGDGFSVKNVMNAKRGFGLLNVEAVLELSGMGAGTGDALQLSEGSSYRLVQLYQTAAARLGNSVTTRGRNLHFGFPAQIGFGGRSGLTLNISWDGSDATAHTTQDTAESISLEKLRKSGQTTLLTLLVLSRETDY